MKGGKRPLGYTIIEVMIVLAVSGVMFVLAATFIAGKQQRTAFTAGSNEFTTQLQTVITQVTDGQYSDIAFGCQLAGGGTSLALTVAGERGKNPQCIFLGKFIHFIEGGNDTKFEIYSLAGARKATTLGTSLATPIVVPGGADLTLHRTVPQSLSVSNVTITRPGSPSQIRVYGFGFVQGLGTVSGDGYASGGQATQMVYSPSFTTNPADPVGALSPPNTLQPADSATVCLTDGSRFATLLFGNKSSGSSQLSVRLQVVRTC